MNGAYNFIAYFWKWGDFLKSCRAKNDLVSKLHFFTIEPYKGQSPTSSCANCIIFLNPWFKYINLSHIFSYTNHKSDKFQSFHAQSAWRYNSQLGPDHMGQWSYKAMCMNSVSCPTVLFFYLFDSPGHPASVITRKISAWDRANMRAGSVVL